MKTYTVYAKLLADSIVYSLVNKSTYTGFEIHWPAKAAFLRQLRHQRGRSSDKIHN